MVNVLDNIVWESLTGPQQRFAAGAGGVRRYAQGFSPILGFADQKNPDLEPLKDFCQPGDSFYTDGWSGPVPSGWNLDLESTMFKMVWDAPTPEAITSIEMVPLGPEHAQAALELAELTHPGPFGIRTIELGDYFGVFEGPRLIAMTGERFHAGEFREISGVATHPDFQGRGLAKALMIKVLRLELERGQTPCLHVMSSNSVARGLYARMGFYDYLESPVRVISRQ